VDELFFHHPHHADMNDEENGRNDSFLQTALKGSLERFVVLEMLRWLLASTGLRNPW